MNQRPVPSKLVNFRIPKALLEPFDNICFLSGKTRTQALSDLVQAHVSDIGPEFFDKICENQKLNMELKNLTLEYEIDKTES